MVNTATSTLEILGVAYLINPLILADTQSEPLEVMPTRPEAPPTKVLLWSPTGSCEGRYGGPCTYSARLYAASSRDNHCVTLAHGVKDHPIWPLFREQQLVYPLLPRPNRLKQMMFIQRATQWIDQRYRDFDIIHAVTAFHFSLAPAVAAKRRGLPAVVVIANSGVELSDKGLLHQISGLARTRRRWICDMDAVICLSSDIVNEVRALGVPETAIQQIPNQCDVLRFRPSASECETSEARIALGWPNRWTALLVGELVPRKRPHLVIEAIHQMTKLGLDVQAALVGPFNDLAYASNLMDMAKQLNIQERVIFDTNNRQVELAYRGSNAFCLPSLNEGMPGSLIEAAASGLPAVVTNFSGAKECVQEARTGFILAEGDRLAERIADVFRTIHDSPELARNYGRAARSHAVCCFSSDATWAAHESLFNRLIRGG